MSDESQVHIPASFNLVHSNARGRLTLARTDFHARYELCEDMAQMLVEPCQARLHELGLSEDLVLERTAAGLACDATGLSPAEATWVVTRLAELLGWQALAGPQAGAQVEAAGSKPGA